jgi:polyphosphate kinase
VNASSRPRRKPGKTGFAPEFYLNRELGLLSFNRRVLAQAENREHPLLERLRFLCIVSSNLDEFFEVRVAGLHAEIEAGTAPLGSDQMRAEQVYRQVAREAHELVARQYQLLNEEILPGMEREGIRFLRRSEFTPQQNEWIRSYFKREVMPVLTPIGLDPAHPFPRVLNKSLNFAVELEGKDAFGRNSGIAIVQAPRVLPRVIRLPQSVAGVEYDFVFLSSVLHEHVGELFSGMKVLGCYQFRLTRNSELFVDEEEVKDLRAALRGELPHRHFGDEVRLEVADSCSQSISQFLLRQFMLDEEDFYRVDGPVNLARVISVPDWVDRPDLKFPQFRPGLPERLHPQCDLFEVIRGGDVLLHHPYQSFQPVISLLQQAARDPAVAAIKMTVYRTGAESELMEVLISAARSGKEVTVVLELMARFDEEANINWAQRLEEVGAHVVYGVVGHKTHAKMLMVLRREGEGLRRYVHLSTGNYHPRTARVYTDFGLFTCHEEIGSDVADVFMQLTGLGRATKLRHLLQSPFTLHREMLRAIENETAIATAGRKGQIIAKMNALLEPEVVGALYRASQAGVQIDLIVRGVCALRPGVAGLSENIRVRSVIGRFLEHTRVFYFHNDGSERVYLSSADWMGRNFFGRVEVCFPVLDANLRQRVIAEGLRPYLDDNTRAWVMGDDGQYVCQTPARAKPFGAQDQLLDTLAHKPRA